MKNKSKMPIYITEYVEINGIEQFLLHTGTKYENPVLLFLHGGPGSVQSVYAYFMQDKWEELYTVVHWDQRGAGKTLTKNPDSWPTIDLLIKDLFDIVQYLKKKYNKQKVVILGHSWGSILGSIFISKYPDEVDYYIGIAQVVCPLEGERIGYEKLKQVVLNAGDKESVKKLEAVGDYPTVDGFFKKCYEIRMLQAKYKLIESPGFSDFITLIKSPVFNLSDFFMLFKPFNPDKNPNKSLIEDFMIRFDLNAHPAEYEVAVNYIVGTNDWQAPLIVSEKYFNKIKAPDKALFVIPDAGHITMKDEPELVFKALSEIYDKSTIK